MSNEIVRRVLSDQVADWIGGRQVLHATFLTYTLEPGFFEEFVLPLFFDLSFSNALPVKKAQLEEALKGLPPGNSIGVLYDANGLRLDGAGPPLDWQRIAMRQRGGLFHAKNVFILVENPPKRADELPSQSLIVMAMSANLTRAGWFTNVEACYAEEVQANERSWLAVDVRTFLGKLRTRMDGDDYTRVVRPLMNFLREPAAEDNRLERRSNKGQLYTRFYGGFAPLDQWLKDAAGGILEGRDLEIVAPYHDGAEPWALEHLLDSLKPGGVSLHTPRTLDGNAACSKGLYDAVLKLDCSWGALPAPVTSGGRGSGVERPVHAKLYRWFLPAEKVVHTFIGSANLTKAAFSGTNNLETGMLVQTNLPGKAEPWLVRSARPSAFGGQTTSEEGDVGTVAVPPVRVRYAWDIRNGTIKWMDKEPSPRLRFYSKGVLVADVSSLEPDVETPLSDEANTLLFTALQGTSFLEVAQGDGERALLLVQEDAMGHKPSVVTKLSTSEILHYWSLLSVEQRAAYLDNLVGKQLDPEVARLDVETGRLRPNKDTLFDHLAGTFHAFVRVEQACREFLDADNDKYNPRHADAILFGARHDSLGTLLTRALENEARQDLVRAYLIFLCAEQLIENLRRQFPEFFQEHQSDLKDLRGTLARSRELRDQIAARNGPEMQQFLDWFEPQFLSPAGGPGGTP